MNIKNIYKYLVDSRERQKREKNKRLDELKKIRALSDNELLLKRSALEANKDSKKLLLTLIMASIMVALLIFFGKISAKASLAYIKLSNKSNVAETSIHEAQIAVYVIIGVSVLLSISMFLVLYLFLREQKKKEELLALYKNEEQRRKQKDGSN